MWLKMFIVFRFHGKSVLCITFRESRFTAWITSIGDRQAFSLLILYVTLPDKQFSLHISMHFLFLYITLSDVQFYYIFPCITLSGFCVSVYLRQSVPLHVSALFQASSFAIYF